MTADEAWQALQAALRVTKPACRGDDRFTADETPAAELRPICEGCPVFAVCADYAAVRPRGHVYGVLAGHAQRAPREHKGRSQNLSPEQVARIHQLRAEGLSFSAIAERLGVGVTTVGRRVRLASQSS